MDRSFRLSLAAGTALAGMALLAPVATAQTTPAAAPAAAPAEETVQPDIVVTGSNIRRSGYSSTAPLQVFTADSPALSTVATINDFVGNLSANAGTQLSNVGTKNATLIGSSYFNLRNLGAGSTLVLINGRRAGKSPLADALGNQFFDLNTLPLSMVKRIDVQTDGASAIYGSEAVAGVVNIVTRLGMNGISADAKADFAVNNSQSVNIAAGLANDRGAFAIYGSYYRSGITYNTDYGFIVRRLHDRNGDGLVDTTANGGGTNSRFLSTSGAPDEYRNFSTGAATGAAVVDPNCAGAGGYVAGSQCLYDFADQSSPIPAERRYSAFGEFRYDLAEGVLGTDELTAFGEFGVSRNRAIRSIGPQSTANGPANGKYVIPANHPFNYFVANGTGLRWAPECFDAIVGNEGGPCVPVAVTTQDSLRPLGQSLSGRQAPLNSIYTNDSQRFLIGLRATKGHWTLEGWAQRQTQQSTRTEPGNYVAARLQAALTAGTINPFGSADATPTAVSLKNPAIRAANNYNDLLAAGVIYTELERREATQTTYDVLLSNDSLFKLPGGAAGFAIGAQHRSETFSFSPDPILGNGFGSDPRPGAPDPSISGSTSVNSAFVEVELPILPTLNVQAAIRYEDHGKVVGTTTNPKLAARFDVTRWLALRGSYGTSFQAPTPNQQGGIVGSGAVNYRTSGGTAVCGGPDQSSYTVAIVGKPVGTLRPQSAENLNLGVILHGDGFNASVDYWRYNYKNLIVNTLSGQALLDSSCAGVAAGDPPRASDLIVRAPNGQPVLITLALQNANKAVTDGVDVAIDYRKRTGIGTFGLGLNMTYVDKFAFTTNGVTTELAGMRNFTSTSFGSLPRWRGSLTGTYESGHSNATAVLHYVSSYTNDDPIGAVLAPRVASYTTLDLQYRRSLEDLLHAKFSLTFGANNVFDRDPPYVGDNRPGYDEQVHSPRGRILYVGVGVDF